MKKCACLIVVLGDDPVADSFQFVLAQEKVRHGCCQANAVRRTHSYRHEERVPVSRTIVEENVAPSVIWISRTEPAAKRVNVFIR